MVTIGDSRTEVDGFVCSALLFLRKENVASMGLNVSLTS